MTSEHYVFKNYDREELLEMADGTRVILNLGCGTDERGIGIDIHYDPDIRHDLNDRIPATDDSVDVLLAEHVLEHLNDATQFFSEVQRVLRPDGELRLELPNVGWWPTRLWASTDLHGFWRHKDPNSDGHWLARRLGNTDAERTKHKTLWTRALVEQYLDEHGFSYSIQGHHWSRNLSILAQPTAGAAVGQTLHELERHEGSDCASGDYWASTRKRVITRWIRDAEPNSVLDLGCGSGYLTAAVARRRSEAEVVGVDIAAESIDVARRRDASARFEVADAFEYDPEQRFEAVILGDVIEHFEDPSAMLSVARELVTDDGVVIVSVPAHPSLFGPHDEYNGHAERYSRARLREVAAAAGLSVAETQHTNLAPLPVYAVYQRLLKRSVPESARGGHGRLAETAKRVSAALDAQNPLPVGITLLARLEATQP